MKKSRKFQAGVDGLESRAVLSTVHPTAHVVPLNGTGTLTTTGAKDVTGGIEANVSLAGKFAVLGKSTGTFTVSVPTGNLSFTAQGVITAANGDQLDVNFAGTSQTPKANATKAVGQFQVNVTGGTGAFAHAKGVGKITVVQNLVTGKETFRLNGRVFE